MPNTHNPNDLKQFKAGDVIVNEGDNIGEMYILLKGTVSTYKSYKGDGETLLGDLNAGSFFAEMSLFLRKAWAATAVAKTDCIVMVINQTNLRQFCLQQTKVTQTMMLTLVSRVLSMWKSCVYLQQEVDCYFSEQKRPLAQPTDNIAPYVQMLSKGGSMRALATTGSFYVVIKGAISTDNSVVFREGNVFIGEQFTSLKGTPLVALEDSLVLVLTPDTLPIFLKTEPALVLRVMQLLCERIDVLNNMHDTLMADSIAAALKDLFPEGHKHYDVAVSTPPEHLSNHYNTCPICKSYFPQAQVNVPKLKVVSTDEDYRIHYDGVEPIYHDVLICPHCYFSALREYFPNGAATEHLFTRQQEAYIAAVGTDFIKLATMNDVFTAYYLALHYTETCYTHEKELIVAKLWLRLSWMYANCGDEAMKKEALLNARDAMIRAYNNADLPQPMLVLGGVLCCQTNDKANAKRFLSQARTFRGGNDKHKEKAREIAAKYGVE